MSGGLRKKGLPEVIVRTMMSLYCGAKMQVRVGSELYEEFLVQVGVHPGFVMSPLLFLIGTKGNYGECKKKFDE